MERTKSIKREEIAEYKSLVALDMTVREEQRARRERERERGWDLEGERAGTALSIIE